MSHTPVSARACAAQLLDAILTRGQTLDAAWAQAALPARAEDQGFARHLALTTLRHLGQVDGVLAQYLTTPLPAKRRAVMQALRLGVVQLLWLDTPAHAAVNESVALIKKGKDAGFVGMVNAVLQAIAKAPPTLPVPSANIPDWLLARWRAAYGPAAVRVMASVAALRPPLDLAMGGEMEGAVRLDAAMQRLAPDHAAVEALPGYEEGAFFVQDIAASYPVRMLGEVRGLRVLDVCAAPGGKAMQLAQRGAVVTALDRSAARMERVHQNAARMRLPVEAVVADALEWMPPAPYDAILLDAPCTATGTWRRHPEVVRLVTLAQIHELAALQRALLARAWGWLTPGGRLVYCVCSLEREEGEAQAEWFAQAHADARLVPVDTSASILAEAVMEAGYLRTTPALLAEQGGMDGFFAVCFEKRIA